MPKIKDLGIKVIPETMRPPQMTDGGCAVSGCGDSGCGATCGQCTNHTNCGNCTHVTCACTLMSCQCSIQLTLCACTHPHSVVVCFGCTRFITCGDGCSVLRSQWCWNATGCGPASPVCTGSIITDPTIGPGGPFTREGISALKDQLREQLAAIEAQEKALLPKTLEQIDARAKAIEEELAQLKQRRKELK